MHVDSFSGLTPETARELITHVGDFLRAVRLCPVPTVAMLNGACVGAAFELSLVCDLRIVRREYPTDIGPVDLLCRDGEGRAVVIEVKRIGEIAGVEQLLRYQERLDLDATLAPTNGLFVATRIKPQARVFAESRGVECIEVDLERLRGDAPPDLRLF